MHTSQLDSILQHGVLQHSFGIKLLHPVTAAGPTLCTGKHKHWLLLLVIEDKCVGVAGTTVEVC